MRRAIDLDDQFAIKGHEIDDVPANRVLAAKFPSRQPSVAQRLPERCLGVGL